MGQTKQEQTAPNNIIDADSSTELVGREITISDDGSALVKETTCTTVKMSSRDFVSWMRKHEQTRDDIKRSLSDEVRTATEEELKKVDDDIVSLKPYIAESEKRCQAHYEQLKTSGMIKKVVEELDKNMNDINLDYMYQVWNNLIEHESDVLAALSKDQKSKFLKIKIRFLTKNRGKKREYSSTISTK